jgi:hypothetical protein
MLQFSICNLRPWKFKYISDTGFTSTSLRNLSSIWVSWHHEAHYRSPVGEGGVQTNRLLYSCSMELQKRCDLSLHVERLLVEHFHYGKRPSYSSVVIFSWCMSFNITIRYRCTCSMIYNTWLWSEMEPVRFFCDR